MKPWKVPTGTSARRAAFGWDYRAERDDYAEDKRRAKAARVEARRLEQVTA